VFVALRGSQANQMVLTENDRDCHQRARWVEAEVVACRRRGETFEDAAQHLMRVARKTEQPRVALDGVEFPALYRISVQGCWAAYHRALDRVPVSEVKMVRKELDAGDEILWAASQPGIEPSDAIVTVNNISTLDLAALLPKERDALKIKLYEIDPSIPLKIMRSIL
jgi:hypothetical protein